MGNDWIRDLLKLLIVQKLIVQSYDFVLTSSFEHFTLGEITVTCLMRLAIYGNLPWLTRNLVAEGKQFCIQSTSTDSLFSVDQG